MRLFRIALIAVFVALPAGCGEGDDASDKVAAREVTTAANVAPSAALTTTPTPAPAPIGEKAPGVVTKADYGKQWPLTVDEAELRCEGSGGYGSATLTTGGKRYALNGIAVGRKDGADMEPIWRADPDTPGLRISMGPLIEEALKLCE